MALDGVAECDRCAGWKTGVCQPATPSAGNTKEDSDNVVPDVLTPAYLESRIKASFTDLAHIDVQDTSDGCGSKFIALIVTNSFDGVKRLQRHRMINGKEGCLANEMENIHALTLKLHTVKEYEKKLAKKQGAQ
jgi:stress-induced morphogen